MEQQKYEITKVERKETIHGSTCWNIEAVEVSSGEVVYATYFGNTRPRKLVGITITVSRTGETYNVATIQKHTSRDKKTGRFIPGPARA